MPRLASSLLLYKGIPWEKNGENQFFNSAGVISTYIEKYQVGTTIYDFSWIREDGQTPIRLSGWFKEWRDVNYLRITNPQDNGLTGYRSVYGFVTNVRYINDNCTYIYWEPDWLATYAHLLDFGQCLVERAHVPPEMDTIQSCACLPEPVSIPFYDTETIQVHKYNYKWHLYSSEKPDVEESTVPGWKLVDAGYPGNEYSACYRYDSDSLSDVRTLVEAFSKRGKLEAVVAVFASADIPDNEQFTIGINSGTTLNGVAVKNNKIFTYPYTGIEVSGPGFAKIYRNELFRASTKIATFNVKQVIQPNGKMMIWPSDYQGSAGAGIVADNVISFGGFRQAAYSANTFMNTIAQSAPSLAMSAVAAMNGSYHNLLYQAGSLWREALVPFEIGGTANASEIIFSDDIQFTVSVKCPNREAIRSIDNYFTLYGYNVQSLKSPMYYWENRGNRKFVYIKTKQCELHGSAPVEAYEYITGLFNRGVRLWDEPDNIGNYD